MAKKKRSSSKRRKNSSWWKPIIGGIGYSVIGRPLINMAAGLLGVNGASPMVQVGAGLVGSWYFKNKWMKEISKAAVYSNAASLVSTGQNLLSSLMGSLGNSNGSSGSLEVHS